MRLIRETEVVLLLEDVVHMQMEMHVNDLFFRNGKNKKMTISPKPLNIFITAVDGTGHINAAIGLGQTAVQRGHKVSFLINETFKGECFDAFTEKMTNLFN